MKKLSCILLAVMLITALFVSCTAEVIDPYDGLAYVTFGGPASKDLSASYEVQSYEDLFWFYTATKTDAYGKTGETKVETPLAVENNDHVEGLGGKIGPFSQGTWNFVLKAYNTKEENRTLVYEGSANGIKLTKSEVKSVPVSVTPQGETGTIEFRNAYFRWNEDNGGSDKPTIKITAVGPRTYTLLSGIGDVDERENVPLKWKGDTLSIDQSYDGVAAGHYKCTVVAWVVDESSPIFEQSFGIRVYGSATTVISGDITEKVDSFVDFEASQEDLVVFKGASSMEVLSTPVNASDKVTTVDFGSNLDGNKTYSLSVKSTTAAEAASKFTVSDGEASVAGIDLTLTTDNTPVTSFDSEITITTYISTGLSGVKVLYGDDGTNYLDDYNPYTGKLVFTTNHFSEYYVVVNKVAEANGKYYGSLQDAIDAAEGGDTVTVLNGTDPVHTIVVEDKTIILDLNGKTISNSADLWDARPYDWSLISVRGTGNLTITGNGTLQAKKNDCYAVDVQDEDSILTIENGTFIGNIHAIYVYTGTANIKGGTYSVQQKYPDVSKADEFVLNCYDTSRANGTAKIVVTGGRFEKFDPADCSAEGSHTNFVAEGYISVRSEDENSYTVRKLAEGERAVADYETLEKAVKEDGTIIITNDIDLQNQEIVVNGKSLTINGNGKKVTYSGNNAAFEMEGNGYNICFLNVSIDSVNGGIWDFGTNGTLEIKNSDIIGANYFALYHNGSYKGFKCKAVDSSFTSDTSAGIYISGSTTTSAAAGRNQKLDLEGCTVTGSTGIEGKYTDMTLTNCTVTALAEAPVFEQYNNGTTTDGFAVVSTDNSMRPDSPKPTAKIIISGGTYKGLIGLASLVNTSQYPDFTEAEYIYENNPSVNN